MMIHLSRIQHSGVDVMVKAVRNKMFAPERLGIVVKKNQDGLLQVQDYIEKNS